MSKHIKLSETFFSIEGEGPLIGRPTFFLRTFGCNFTCSGFSNPEGNKVIYLKDEDRKSKDNYSVGCDSAYSWHPAYKNDAENVSVEDVASLIAKHFMKGHLVSITGGEPLLWSREWLQVLSILRERFSGVVGQTVKPCLLIETNGSIELEDEWAEHKSWLTIYASVSPKLSNSGEPREKALIVHSLESLIRNSSFVYFKFVTKGTVEELAEICTVVSAIVEHTSFKEVTEGLTNSRIWLMPEGALLHQQKETQLKVAEAALSLSFNFSPRIHVDIWGNKKGT